MSLNKSPAMANIQARADAALATKAARGQTDLFDDVAPPAPPPQPDIEHSPATPAKEPGRQPGLNRHS